MDIRIRRALLLASVAIFLIIAPVVVMYALGYRRNFMNNPQAVGVLLLESLPTRARIFVNGQPRGETPRAVPNLDPGSVQVRLEKEGYHPWQKQLPIEAAKATEARDIRLFLQDPDRQVLMNDIQTFTLSPDRNLIAAMASSTRLHITDVDGDAVIPPIELEAPPNQLLWSPNSSLILIGQPDRTYQLLDVSQTANRLQPLPALKSISELTWHPRTSNALLGLTANQQLISYSLTSNTQTPIAQRINTYATSNRAIFTATSTGSLVIYDFDGDREEEMSNTELFLEPKDIDRLLVTPAGAVAILTADNSLYTLSDNETGLVSSNVFHAAWSPDGHMLMVQPRENELYVYNIEDERAFHIPLQKMHFITRLSRPIRHAQWFAGGRHLIYQVDDAIMVTEIDTRDHPISHKADTTNLGDAAMAVGEDGATLFYIKRQNDNRQLILSPLVEQE